MSFIDKLGKFIDEEAEEIRRRQDEEDKAMAKFHQGQIDQLQAKDLAKQEAIMKRAETLNMAWVAANLLKAAGVTPDNWLGKEPIYEKTRFRKRLELVDEKEVLLADGWEVLQWQYSRYQPHWISTLILTPEPPRGRDSHLMHFKRPGVNEFRHQPGEPVKESFMPLPRTPLDETDMAWPKKWAETDELWRYRGHGEALPGWLYVHERELGDRRGYIDQYTLYNESGAEERVQRALARLAASHDITIPSAKPN
jgi:hypothetical protein